jgi:hypothetical protein
MYNKCLTQIYKFYAESVHKLYYLDKNLYKHVRYFYTLGIPQQTNGVCI